MKLALLDLVTKFAQRRTNLLAMRAMLQGKNASAMDCRLQVTNCTPVEITHVHMLELVNDELRKVEEALTKNGVEL